MILQEIDLTAVKTTRDSGVIRFKRERKRIVVFTSKEQENGFLKVFW